MYITGLQQPIRPYSTLSLSVLRKRLRARRLNHKLIQLFKMTHQISPPYLQSILLAAVENRYNTRNSTNNSLPVRYAKLSSTRNSFVPSSIKESFSFKTRMPGTVKCRPTVAYRVQIDGINIATELITRYYSNETLIQ